MLIHIKDRATDAQGSANNVCSLSPSQPASTTPLHWSGPSGNIMLGDLNDARDEQIEDHAAEAAATAACKLLPFWRMQPALWFRQIDSVFITKRFRNKEIKFHLFVAALDPDNIAEIYDLPDSTFGTTLCIPGDFFVTPDQPANPQTFV